MRYLILSDIHGNWEALQAVLRRTRRKHFDATLLLGDLVGYGAAPNLVIQAVTAMPGQLFVVRGNHDKVVSGIERGEDFNETALKAATWTAAQLTPVHRGYLERLPAGPRIVERDGAAVHVAICHGSPVHEDMYIFGEHEAWESFLAAPQAHVTFFGHTHVPCLFIQHPRGLRGAVLRDEGTLRLSPSLRYLVNPGSIGQPRDRDPRAAFMIYDSARRTLTWRRLRYPITGAQERIRRAGLPSSLADRLSSGL
jgi:predicted phosphodiesterase